MTLSTRDREPEPVPPLAGPAPSTTTTGLGVDGIAEAFARVVASAPDATAVVSAGRRFSYRELDHRADALADALPDHVGVESVVGVCLRPGVDLVAAVLAVARRGAAFLLMDSAHPRERLAHLVRAAGARCVLVPRGLSDASIGGAVPIVAAHKSLAPDPPARSPQRVGPDNLGYVVFTSGSTGAPKPVGVGQGALLNLIRWTAGEYRIRPDDRLLPTHAPGFDASVRELLLPLLTGASLVLGDGDERFEPARLLDVVSAEGVTLLDVVPTLLRHLLDEPQAGIRLAPVRLLTCGGEELPPSTARRLRSVAPWIRLYNQYGPSEATVAATSWSCTDQEDDERSPIGTPIVGARAYVLGQDLRPVAQGLPGELFLGGRGVARGYPGVADLTAELFLPDPFHGEPGMRMYRTGDLVRVQDDGNLVFLGRLDDQVSVGGHRIEPGEVAATLRRFAAVTDVAVVPVHDGPGAPCLAAYVVPAGDGVDESALRDLLAQRLPSFMMPRHVSVVDRLPVTDTGKIDRGRLPALTRAQGARPPGTDTERAIAEVVRAVLGLGVVGADDDVFALGADSLGATRIAMQAGAVLGVHLEVHDVFTHRSVAALARAAADAPPTRDVPADEADVAPYELSLAQRRLWFLDQLNTGNIAYNVCVGYQVSGRLDVTALTEALRAVAVRHECLRGTIVAADGRPRVRLLPPEQVIGQLTVRAVVSPAEAEKAARVEAAKPFDLAVGPLMRATVLRIGPTEHLLLVVVHHLVFDGWSLGPFERHLSDAYRDALVGRPRTPASSRQYRHFVAWQRRHLSEERISDVVGYWSRRLSGLDLVLEMPGDRPHPAVPSYRAAAVPVRLPAPVVVELRRLADQRRATLFMVTFAVYQLLIGRYTGRDAFVVGCPSVGRPGSDFEDMVGFFVNTLPMRADLSGDPSFAGLVERVRDTATSAYAHQDLPFERLAEHLAPARDLNRNPVVQIWFDLFSAPDSLDLPGATSRWHPPATVATRFDLELHLSDSPSGALDGELVYATDLYERETVEQYARHFENLARLAAARPDIPLSEVDMLLDEERDRILHGWTDTAAPYRADRTVPTLFEEQVARTPDEVALVFDGVRMSFAELNRRANRLAHHLRGCGVRRGQVVALFLPPGLDAVVGLLAVVKTGAGYLPVDVDSPGERVAFMLADAGAEVVLTLTALAPDLPLSVVCVDADSAVIASCVATDPTRTAAPDDLLYVIYTSGSTGRPKGVVMTHRPLLNLLDWQLRRAEPAGPTLQFSALHFDISFQEMFSSWLCGRPVVLLDRDQRRDPEQLLAVMTANGVRRLFCTPLVLEQIAQAAAGGTELPPLAQIATAGEQLHLTAEVRDLLRRLPGVVLDNQYGPTEAHVVTAEMLSGDPQDWPVFPLVGSAIANTRIYLLDERMRPVPPRAAGEVYVGGTCLARGYIGRPDLTADRFVPDPFGVEPGTRLYRTGDLARWTLDGRLEFLGRTDHQVKIRGHRVELGEIEVSLTGHPDVAEAAVLAVGHGANRSLVAYVVPRRDGAPDPKTLRGFLLARLPSYMIPSAFVTVPALPLTAAGKLDRAGLAALDDQRGDAERDSAILQPHERIIADIWAGHLSGQVGIDDDFFGLGGHSLMATSVVHEIRTAFDIALPLRAIFENRTVRELAATVAAAVVAQIEAMTDDDVAAAVHDTTPHAAGNGPAGHERS
ncbi:amino acid adenylation domain-containing protein [Plantactinospora sp. WMMC1484]|uniref:amino acid adenylation domain-containing protein n=1 Tax=Plantactinospora sp. WMMC1484 TaxID=3404122 RepID=UPI003BF4C85E